MLEKYRFLGFCPLKYVFPVKVYNLQTLSVFCFCSQELKHHHTALFLKAHSMQITQFTTFDILRFPCLVELQQSLRVNSLRMWLEGVVLYPLSAQF